MRVARFTSTQQPSEVRQHCTLIGKVHLPFPNQSSHFLPQPTFSMSSSASLSSFDLQLQNLIPFSEHLNHPLSSTQMSPTIQQLTALPRLSRPISCSGSHSSLTCSTHILLWQSEQSYMLHPYLVLAVRAVLHAPPISCSGNQSSLTCSTHILFWQTQQSYMIHPYLALAVTSVLHAPPLSCSGRQQQYQHHLLRPVFILELSSTSYSHHVSLCPSKNTCLTSFRHHTSLPCSITGLTCLLYTAPFSLRGNLLPYSNSPHSITLTHRHLVLAVTAASHPPPAITLSPRYVNYLSFHYITFLLHCLSNIPFSFSACSIS